MTDRAKAVLVLGMHRSGTSALTGALQALGVALGDHLLPEKEDNRAGFFEHAGVVACHEQFLTELNAVWHQVQPLPASWETGEAAATAIKTLTDLCRREFGDTHLWGVKDPRLCRLLPLWRPVLAALDVEPVYLLMVRHPMEVALSLQKRDGFSLDKGLLLWLDHLVQSEWHSRNSTRAWLSYDQLLADPDAVFARLSAEVGLPKAEPESRPWEVFLKRDLRHHHQPEWPQTPIAQMVRPVFEAIQADPQSPDYDGLRAMLTTAGVMYGPLMAEQARVIQDLGQEIQTSREAHEARDQREAEQVASIRRFEALRDELETGLREFDEQLTIARAGMADLESQLAVARVLDADKSAQLAAAKAGQDDLEAQLSAAKSGQDDLERQLEASRAQNADLATRVDQARAGLAAKDAEIEAARGTIARQAAEIEAARGNLTALSADLEATQAAASAMETQLKTKLKARDEELAQAAASGRALESQLEVARESGASMRDQIEGARENMRILEAEIATARTNLEALAKREADLQALAADRAAELENLRWRRLLGRMLGVKQSD